MIIASLVLGILGLVFCWFPFVGIILCTLAVIFGAMKMKTGMGIAGFILGLVGLPISVLITILILTS